MAEDRIMAIAIKTTEVKMNQWTQQKQRKKGVGGGELPFRVQMLPLISLNLFDNCIMCSSKETKGDKGLKSYIDKLCVVLKNGMEYLV